MQGMLFAKILKMSLTGSCGIGIVLAARVLLKRCGSVYAYYLWVLMFAGLCLPISVDRKSTRLDIPIFPFLMTTMKLLGWQTAAKL